MEIAELFNQLESNQPEVVEEIKNSFHENFHSTKDSYLVNGLFDYYLSTSSLRCVDVLVGVREPHDKYLFDRISESLKSAAKLQALTLLGHIVRRHPTWIYKITNHSLMKELLKLLKVETDIVPLMSALLVLIVLLPMIPTLVGPFLQDIFDIFSRLAAWNTNNPNKLPEEHLLHLQVGLYALFHRLYGMYPCNFLSYLRHEYGQKENLGIFGHTIKPMLDTVRMHPLLVTASKDAETAATRWLRMEHHDVIVECSKFSLDGLDRNRDEVTYQSLTPSLLSRYSLEHSQESTSQGRGSVTYSQAASDKEIWSPSLYCGMTTPPLPESVPASIPQTPNSQTYSLSSSLPHPEGTSPPEAAIEATPETTPIKDMRHMGRPAHPLNSNVARALTSFTSSGGTGKWAGLTSGNTTPSQSQPSSPMKKELSPFRFPTLDGGSKSAFEQPRRDSIPSAFEQRRDSLFSQKVQRVQQDRIQMAAAIDSPTGDKQTPGSLRASTRAQICQPTSPLRIINNEASIPSSPVHMESAVSTPGARDYIGRSLPEKNGLGLDIADNINSAVQADSCQEDQEVLEIVSQGEQLRIDTQPKNICSTGPVPQRQCDSVLQEIHPPHVEEYEECQQESGSPCTSGGLHMPNSISMLDFARRVQQQHRHRYYSQCMPETKSLAACGFSTGSSPGEGSAFPIQPRVRRANSCPEMKKGPVLPGAEANVDKTLDEKEELEIEASIEDNVNKKLLVNGNEVLIEEAGTKELVTSSTQTVDHWTPLPYEHLFMGVFPPSVEQSVHHHNGEVKPSPAPSPGPQAVQQHPEGFPRFSPYTILDKYIDTAVQGVLREDQKKPKGFETELKILKEQLTLLILQLQFERYRREVHAERNRRLLGKSRTNRALEEHNSALRDQLGLLQKEIENLHNEREKIKKENNEKEQTLTETVTYWKNQSNSLQKEIKELKTNNQLLEEKLKQEKENTESVTKELQRAESLLFEVGSEMRLAKEHASASEQLRRDLEHLQKEIVLMGELQQKFRDRFAQMPLLRHHEDEADHLQDTYCEELKAMREMLDTRTSCLEATKARVAELETFLARRDMTIAEQKRVLKQVKEEYQEQLEAVESKYKTQRSITQSLEGYVLELHNKLDVIENNSRRKGTRSPDISGAQEVSVASTGSADKPTGASNFSPHSSPLSQSLGSVEGLSLSGMSGAGDIEMKNLQVIIDEPEQLVEATATSAEQKEHQGNTEQEESNTKSEKNASTPASPGEDG